MNRCEQIQEWIERILDENRPMPPEIEAHLTLCETCRDYYAALRQTMCLLEKIEIPPPPETMVNDVMGYIENREAARKRTFMLLPGLAVFISLGRTVRRYLPDLRLVPVLKREAWPTAIATFFIIFGTCFTQLSEPQGVEKFEKYPVVMEVNSMAARIRESGDHFLQRVDTLRKDWFGEPHYSAPAGGAPFGRESMEILK